MAHRRRKPATNRTAPPRHPQPLQREAGLHTAPEQHDASGCPRRDDLADARAEHAVNRAQVRQSRKRIREVKRGRCAEAVARAATTVTPATRGALMVAGTASLAGAVTQLATGDGSGAADWLSAGIGCWTLAVLRR